MRLEVEGLGGAAMRGGYTESGGNARILKGMGVGRITLEGKLRVFVLRVERFISR
jgi:hypothetical protein